jgi:hypothetical protein
VSYHHLDTGHVHDAGHTVGAAAGNTLTDRARAVRTVAAYAVDAEDCAALLAALGLVPAEGLKKGEVT